MSQILRFLSGWLLLLTLSLRGKEGWATALFRSFWRGWDQHVPDRGWLTHTAKDTTLPTATVISSLLCCNVEIVHLFEHNVTGWICGTRFPNSKRHLRGYRNIAIRQRLLATQHCIFHEPKHLLLILNDHPWNNTEQLFANALLLLNWKILYPIQWISFGRPVYLFAAWTTAEAVPKLRSECVLVAASVRSGEFLRK